MRDRSLKTLPPEFIKHFLAVQAPSISEIPPVLAKSGWHPSNSLENRGHSPSHCTGARKVIRRGNPSPDQISTSYVEPTNLSVCLFNRRFTRLTPGCSKNWRA